VRDAGGSGNKDLKGHGSASVRLENGPRVLGLFCTIRFVTSESSAGNPRAREVLDANPFNDRRVKTSFCGM
jgi:hypothetical protein